MAFGSLVELLLGFGLSFGEFPFEFDILVFWGVFGIICSSSSLPAGRSNE